MKRKTLLLWLFCALATCLALTGCGKKEEPPTPEVIEEPLPEIETPALGMAIIDLETIYLSFHKTKAAQAKVDKNIEAARAVGRPLLGELNFLREKLSNPNTNPAEAERLNLQAQELRKRLDEMTAKAPPVKIPEEEKQAILGELSQLIGEFVEAEGYTAVLNRRAGGKFGPTILPVGNFPDLTRHVIQHLEPITP